MITGDLVRHRHDDISFGVITKVNDDSDTVQILWLDWDHPTMEWYSQFELKITSSADLDWENDVIILGA